MGLGGRAFDDIIAKIMEHKIIRLPVVDEDAKLIGVIARADILSRLVEPVFVALVGT